MAGSSYYIPFGCLSLALLVLPLTGALLPIILELYNTIAFASTRVKGTLLSQALFIRIACDFMHFETNE